MPAPVLILFDGVCNFCNASVNFIIDRDPLRRFQFASQQSDVGQRHLRARGLPTRLTSLVVVDGDDVLVRSQAVLRIARYLPWPWPLLRMGVVIPRPIADWLYDLFATYRYRLFGQTDTCRLPTPELAGRIIG